MSRAMKDSGIPWIGEIPKEWNCSKTKFFTRISSGDGISNEELQDGGEYEVLGGGSGIMGYHNNYNIDGDNLIIGRVGACGYVKRTNGKRYVSDNALIMRITSNTLLFNYLYYVLTSAELSRLNTSTAQPLITATKVYNVSIPLPSLAEQQRIAEFLDRKCGEVDEMIALQEQIIEELKAYKQSVITEAVTKGLNPDVPMKDSGIEWIGEIPERWSLYRIKYNTFLKGRIGWQGLNSNDFIDEGYCLITGTDFDNKGGINWDTCYRISKERFDEDELLHIKNGDLLMTKDGTVGKMAYIQNLPEEASLNSHLLIIRQTTNIISNEFLYWVMLSNVFKRFCSIYQSGSIMSSISQSTLGMMSCYCPSIEEQNSIVTYLKTKCTEIDSLINIKLSKIDSLKEYKKSIIYEYVTGKKEITE